MKFNEATRTLETSVRELTEGEGFARIGFERGEGWNRLGLGAELHTRVLRDRCQRNPAYRSEVFVQARWPIDDWTAVVTGRLDGCLEKTGGGWLIEEFKSTYVPTAEIRRVGGVFDRHQRQLLIYCHLWTRLGHSPVSGALVYVDLASGAETPITVEYDPEQSERELRRRLQRALAVWKAESLIRAAKARVAAAMPFPHREPRPGQKLMLDAVRDATQAGEHLIAEAPTGSGKTAAALYPALAQGLASGRQVVFLTSKTLQQKMAVSALRAMNTEGAFRTLQLRNKEKMCANDRVLCHEDFCPYAKGFPEKMESSGIMDRLRQSHWHYDPDAVFAAAKSERVCPFETQLELARGADAIVADYNYVFDPGAALRHLGEDELGQAILLIDEAHNLPDRARQIFSPEILEKDCRAVLSRLTLQPGELFESLAETIGNLRELFVEQAESLPANPGAGSTHQIAEIAPPTQALRALWKDWEAKFVRYLSWKREVKFSPPEDPIVDLHFAWQRLIAGLNLFGPGFTCVIERRPEGLRLALICLDPARAVGPIFRAANSAVLFSATLSPVDVVRRSLGLEKDRTRAISLPPPFPRENRKVMILPQALTTYAARENNFVVVASLLAEMSNAQTGNSLALFPSYQFLRRVAEKLPPTRATVFAQRPNSTDAERQEILAALSAPPVGGVLVLAALGGMYAEGVDYPGELLSGVYIVSPALPQVSFERELLRRYFDQTDQAGFEYSYLQPGMTRVIQAAGRLIRSETDRGVIALLCQRFLRPPYADRLPRDWYDDSPLELIARDPAAEIRKFFAQS